MCKLNWLIHLKSSKLLKATCFETEAEVQPKTPIFLHKVTPYHRKRQSCPEVKDISVSAETLPSTDKTLPAQRQVKTSHPLHETTLALSLNNESFL